MESPRQVRWADTKKDENCESTESSSMNVSESDSHSEPSSSSSLSADLADNATSSSSSSNSSPSRGALYQFADLMAQLPIKRGLSKYYNGKSESFASLVSVRSVEDLAKRMKSCKSYGSNLNRHKFSPKATIAKSKSKRSPKRRRSCLTFSPEEDTSRMAVI